WRPALRRTRVASRLGSGRIRAPVEEARLGIPAEHPSAVAGGCRVRGAADGEQRVLGRQLEHLHADELPRSRLPRDVQDQVAVTDPGARAAAEADAVVFAECLLLVRRL